MNKRIQAKVAKRKAIEAKEALAHAPLMERVTTEVAQTATHVMAEVNQEVQKVAVQAEELLEKVPVVGETASKIVKKVASKIDAATA